MSRSQQKRKRSIGALIAGISLATATTVGSGLSGVLPGLSTKARAATTLKGLVYVDLNQNGVQDITTDVTTNEFGYANVTVNAFAKNGSAAGATTTGANGTWQIVTDAAGPYRVEFSNYASTKIASGPRNGGTSVQFPTGANPVNFTLFGKVNGLGALDDLAFETLEIGNFVWNDTNGNGIQDPEEPGIPGVSVNLVDEFGAPAINVNTGAVLPTQITNSAGEYYFTNLGGPRGYRVVIAPGQPALSGLTLTTQFARTNGGNALNDSNGFYVLAGSPETALSTTPIGIGSIVGVAQTAGPGQNDHAFDFGFVTSVTNPKLSLGDFVFIDANRNGIQDEGDTPVAGAKVELLDGNGAPIANQPSITTLADGKYLFTGLNAGSYRVRFTRPSGTNVVPTSSNVGSNDDIDSDIVAENTESAITGVIALTNSTVNVDAGWVTPAVKGKIGDRVFIDTNRNGIQDDNESGLGGVRVVLETCQGVEIFSQATLDGGLYEFSGLDAGQYRIRFVLPAGYDFTGKNAGSNQALDSDADPVTGASGCVTLAAGETNLTVDAGLVARTVTTTTIPTVTTTTTIPTVTTTTIPTVTTTTIPTVTTTTIPATTTTTTIPVVEPAKIGDRVFIDTNRNGVQDPTETGVIGARVNLETCAGTFLRSVLTIADGRYEFANLAPGQYRVRFELPAGYDFTSRNVGSDRGLDSDADQASGVTGCVTVVAGQFDPTVDAGIVEKVTTSTLVIVLTPPTTTVPPTTVPVTTTPVVISTGCIGDKVFEGKAGDKDGKGIPGITLVLITPEGTSLSTTTDANGLYRFCTLKPGVYTVRVTVPPVDATNIYTLDGKNNNATSVKLDAGKDNLDADFGYELKKVQVLPVTVDSGPDFPETPIITPSVTGSNGTRQALAALAMILTGIGMVGLLRGRKERWQ